MADMLGTGLSSLRALQRALDTTAHNIANVSTEGYTRQRVEFADAQAAGLWIQLDRQRRERGGRASRLRPIPVAAGAQLQRHVSRASMPLPAQAERLDNLLGDTQQRASTPRCRGSPTPSAKFPARRARFRRARCCWPRANALAERLKSYDTRLREMSAERGSQLVGRGRRDQCAGPGHRAPERRHRHRHSADRPAAERPARSARRAHRPAFGQGRRLRGRRRRVHAQRIHRHRPAAGARHHGLADHHGHGSSRSGARAARAADAGAAPVDISRSVSGGTLGGLLDFRKQMLDPARNELGRIGARPWPSQVNAQHREGMDLTGALGGDFFNVGAVGVLHATANTGSAAVTVTRTNLGALTANDYVLTRTGHGLHARAPGHGRGGRLSPARAPWPILAAPMACRSWWAPASPPATSS